MWVDECHRGIASGSGGFMYRYRRQLASKGFTFEYSATFAQSAINDSINKDMGTSLRQSYTKAILFDYSYRYFYADGYRSEERRVGKECRAWWLTSSCRRRAQTDEVRGRTTTTN